MHVIRTDDTYSTYSDNPCPSPNASDTNNICAIGDDLPPSIVEGLYWGFQISNFWNLIFFW